MDTVILEQMLNISKDSMKKGEIDIIEDFFTNEKVIKYLQSLMINPAYCSFIRSATISNCMVLLLEMGMDSEKLLEFSSRFINDTGHCDSNEKTITDIQKICFEYTKLASEHLKNKKENLADKVNKYISNHLLEKIVISDIAKEFGISESTLHTTYHHLEGETIYHTILKKKLNHAKFLVEFTNTPISDISYQLSFSSQSHFTDKFRSYFGITPKQLRIHGDLFNKEID